MKKISRWASQHKWPARMLLVITIQLLNIAGIITGVLLKGNGMLLPGIFFLLAVVLYLLGVLFYPKRSARGLYKGNAFYIRQKTCDGLLALSAFAMFVYIGNEKEPFRAFYSQYNASAASVTLPVIQKDSSFNAFRVMLGFARSMKDDQGQMLKWKERKKLLKQQLAVIKQSTELSAGAKTALTILCILVALGLIFLAIGLACNLSCNGHDGAAALVLVGGPALVIILLVFALRALYPGKRRLKLRALRKEEAEKKE